MDKCLYIKRLSQVIFTIIVGITLIANPIVSYSLEKNKKATAKYNNNLSANEKALHVLNRLGYGPRPGDLEKVQRMGIEKYIEWQLNPEKIDDQMVEARLKGLTTLSMDPQELARAYPPPALLKAKKEAELKNTGDETVDKAKADKLARKRCNG